MAKLDFSATLKAFLAITDLKMKDVSDYLEYDVSYINKWINGKNLPSQASLSEVIDKLGKFFGVQIYEMNKGRKLEVLSDRKVGANTVESSVAITRSLLMDGYYRTIINNDAWGEVHEPIETIINDEEVIERAFLEIEKAIAISTKDLNIYFTLDLYSLFKKIFLADESFYVTKGITINIYWLMEKDSLILKDGLEDELYYLLGKAGYFNTKAYLADEMFTRPYIYIEDQMAMSFVQSTQGETLFMNLSEDPHILNEYKQMTQQLFKVETLLLDHSGDLNFEFNRIMESLRSGNEFLIYSTFFEGSFFSEELLKKVMDRNKVPRNEQTILMKIRRAYEMLMEEYPVTILKSKKSLISYMPQRLVIFGTRYFCLTEEEWEEYEVKMKETIDKNPKIKIGLLYDDIFSYKLFDQGVTMVASKNNFWFKKDPLYLDEYVEPYYYIVQPKYIDKINKFTGELEIENAIKWLKKGEYLSIIQGIMISSE